MTVLWLLVPIGYAVGQAAADLLWRLTHRSPALPAIASAGSVPAHDAPVIRTVDGLPFRSW